MKVDVLIIGGGAAGLFCAMQAGRRGRRVLVVEHANRIGKKILMSGGGRCNFTNLHVSAANYLSANPHFCKSALARYRPADFIALVERHGIAYHEKERGQLFCDESSKLIVRMLESECRDAGVGIEVSCTVHQVQAHADGFELSTSIGSLRAPKLVVASGGLSIPSMGASGFGYTLARQFGHRILPTRAGLVPLTLSGRPLEQWQDLSGLALNAVSHCGQQQFEGGVLITHRGLSGPAILQISSYWQPGLPLHLDYLPGREADEELLHAKQQSPTLELRNLLAEWLPRRFAQRLCETGLGSRPLHHYREAELRGIAQQLQRWPVQASGTEGYRTAEVTLGGVDTDELSSTTMESRLQPGLHFIGEVVDVTGHLGGFNFQWAWASAHAAAQAL